MTPRSAFIALPLIALTAFPAWAAPNPLCTRLRDFRTASFDKDSKGKPVRRTIEFHFIGDWPFPWTKECRHLDKGPGKALCPALMDNSNAEFREILPVQILTCYGWKMPTYVYGWDIQRATFKLDTDEKGKRLKGDTDRRVLLEIDYRYRKKPHEAIRLSIIPSDEDFAAADHLLNIYEPDNPPIEREVGPP